MSGQEPQQERRRADPSESILREIDGMRQDAATRHKEHREDMQAMRAGISDVRVDVAGLKVKAGIWGAMAGIVPAGLLAAGLALKTKLTGGP